MQPNCECRQIVPPSCSTREQGAVGDMPGQVVSVQLQRRLISVYRLGCKSASGQRHITVLAEASTLLCYGQIEAVVRGDDSEMLHAVPRGSPQPFPTQMLVSAHYKAKILEQKKRCEFE